MTEANPKAKKVAPTVTDRYYGRGEIKNGCVNPSMLMWPQGAELEI